MYNIYSHVYNIISSIAPKKHGMINDDLCTILSIF